MVGLILTLFVAALHVVFFVVESLLWTTPAVRKRFLLTAEQAAETKVLASNQGVYNAALAVTLAWAALTGEHNTTLALLLFVVVVGVYGAVTANRNIFFAQALPAILALGCTWFGL